MGTLGAAATDTRASTAIALTRASLAAVASTPPATEVILAWLIGVARISAVADVARPSAIKGHDPICIPFSPAAIKATSVFRQRSSDTWAAALPGRRRHSRPAT